MLIRVLRQISAIVLLGSAATMGAAQDASGDYLAGRIAAQQHDYAQAAEYYTRAIARDRRNLNLLNSAMGAYLSAGEADKATTIAKVVASQSQNLPVAALLLLVDNLKRDDFDGAAEQMAQGRVAGNAIDQLLVGWVQMGQGQVSNALATFDAAASVEGVESFALYQKALALSLVGDFEGAEGIFADQLGSAAATLRGSLARAQILAQLDRREDAIKLLAQIHGENGDQQALALRARLEAGVDVEFNLIQSPAEGAAEVLFSLASALRGDGGEDGLLIYARLAQQLAPRNVHAILLSAELLEDLENYQLASSVYDQVPRSHPAYVTAEIGRAEALYRLDQPDAAIMVIAALAEAFPAVRSVRFAHADLLRRAERYGPAIAEYDVAISMIEKPNRNHWFHFYVRAISHHQNDNWAGAEADFRRALTLAPGEARVLNYLGYSLVERGENLDEALVMISQAVAAQPDAGYIIDSLGWAQFRMGQFEDAVINLERAAELMATDPVVNDHLGDAYWVVGRKTEAKFQWRRALSFISSNTNIEDIDPAELRQKLAVGLSDIPTIDEDDG